ncbi:MAG: acyl-CoA dehydratase activase [Lachnospiraceae bacterium]|nr:acyl-CoA dehydratase activase [Lachnospiraceae bacterium]
MEETVYRIGIDVGSTTTKIALLKDGELIFYKYIRHFAKQRDSITGLLDCVKEELEGKKAKICLTGSGARIIADRLGLPFTQEVVANSLALRKEYHKIGTAIELGGQDAKIIFFRDDEKGESQVFDMRMNGSCAGGTGAFIDEVATVLGVDASEMRKMADEGESVYDISGRCGVFAKTDIQALLNQGVKKNDIALSSYHAIAKQTIGGLSQGLDIKPPVAFEGGPLTFHPRLCEVFKDRLELEDKDVIVPQHPEMMVAYGAGLSIEELHEDSKDYSVSELIEMVSSLSGVDEAETEVGQLYFETKEEYEDFKKRHPKKEAPDYRPGAGETVNAYLGIDSGSTTTKLVLMNENEEIIDSWYSSNGGNPLDVAKKALLGMYKKYNDAGAKLNILAAASTGYGEFLFNKAFRTEAHVVETVAHSLASAKYVDDPSFILDIGGQDMKAIWLEGGIITNIVVNEACSSGCGSFLENFAHNLQIETKEIAERAFASENPAKLGSRCTVFMNSSIITEQRNGKQPNDIMAGLCRSIIENVFTKVIRVPNIDSLGKKIVVQGGTFQNDAVLRAMEQYVDCEVIRAPYAGLMGAIGSALRAKEKSQEADFVKSFISYEELEAFSYTQQANSPCPYCTNHCNRAILTFSTGDSWVTNNRCEKGEVIGDPKDKDTIRKIKELNEKKDKPANLYEIRKNLQMKDYPYETFCEDRGITIGIPRVLNFWEGMPFWSTFFKSLGFGFKTTPVSNRKIYENGIHAVPSDTECFPAKLVHGHIRELVKSGVDRIFMPEIVVMPSENKEETSFSRCALVKGYPIVIKNSDNPFTKYGVPFDSPYFYWYTEEDREKQITEYMYDTYDIDRDICLKAVRQSAEIQRSYDRELKAEGRRVIEDVSAKNSFAVVLAGRPYHNDPLINHELPELLVSMGVPVLTADSLPDLPEVELRNSRIDIVNNFHARMLGSSILAAKNNNLEYIQIVSFGCGHDAVLSDEIVRMMKEISNKAPLILKVDESDAQGPLRIRVRSFIETIQRKRNMKLQRKVRELSDPYPVKFTKKEVKEKIVLVPNSSHAFCQVMSAAFKGQKLKTVPLDVGREEAIRLGKRYTHNDICFPAQIVIGEILAELKSGKYDTNDVSVAMAKYLGCCRLPHYATILRKALDDAGFAHVAIVTNDDVDLHDMHPGFKMNAKSLLRVSMCLPIIDTLEEVLRKIRPYELIKGSADAAFEKGMDMLVKGLEKFGILGAINGFKKALKCLTEVKYDDSVKKPTVLIVGEYLLNFHPGANHDIEKYLEDNGFEIIEAKMTDVIQKSYFCQHKQIEEFGVKRDKATKFWSNVANIFFTYAHKAIDHIARHVKLHDKAVLMEDLGKVSDDVIHHTFDTGEGILIPAEIMHYASHGCKNFVILQPFGCLPNHVIGRGVCKKLKEMYPDIELLPLDYDPDVSFANIENRLQMLIMNQQQVSVRAKEGVGAR